MTFFPLTDVSLQVLFPCEKQVTKPEQIKLFLLE